MTNDVISSLCSTVIEPTSVQDLSVTPAPQVTRPVVLTSHASNDQLTSGRTAHVTGIHNTGSTSKQHSGMPPVSDLNRVH